jgi:hypothetical protein
MRPLAIRKAVCPAGHKMTEANIIVKTDRYRQTGYPRCRICHNEQARLAMKALRDRRAARGLTQNHGLVPRRAGRRTAIDRAYERWVHARLTLILAEMRRSART